MSKQAHELDPFQQDLVDDAIKHAKRNFHTHWYVLSVYISNSCTGWVVTSGYDFHDALEKVVGLRQFADWTVEELAENITIEHEGVA